MKASRVVAIGTSSGGLDALKQLVPQLPADLPASVLIVRHTAADSDVRVLVDTLNAHGTLQCNAALHGQTIENGQIYVAPADHHLMVGKGCLMVTKGAQENRSRPAIDPLFRSMAVSYGHRGIAVLLTGNLDDGTSGMVAVKRCGGLCVVQDPDDAAYPDMPANARRQVDVDHCVPMSQMGGLLASLVREPPGPRVPVPDDIAIEAKIAERVLSDLASVNSLGDQAPFNCPGCGGVLWQVGGGKALRYRCHTGHAYTAPALLEAQSTEIEETLWVALRMFEERRNLLGRMAESESTARSKATRQRVKDSEVHIKRIKEMLKADQQNAG